ncbi:MAG: NDP-sugar synthase [bacterium]|nr:NDP-sugar synthase [bacterium]
MKALILAAGLGKRLRPLTDSIPKSLIRFGNREAIFHVLEKLRDAGINHVGVNLHHLWKDIVRFFATTSELADFSFYFSYEENLLGTGGAIINCRDFLLDDDFIVINSDIYSELDLKKLIAFHNEKGSSLTLAFKPGRQPTDLKIDSAFHITEFAEKNFRPDSSVQGGIYTGISVWKKEVISTNLKSLAKGKYYEFSEDIILPLLREGTDIFGYPHYDFWMDFGTPENLKRLQYHFKKK